jgi:Kef-type K+ transport system membrane component KefB/mannitol/fructose-specific phosphotransferase system IIA component (Ntr-type)
MLSHDDVTTLMLGLAVLLASARLMGELARRLHQPSVLGEIIAGVLLGPTVLGRLTPDAAAFLFPAEGHAAVGRAAIESLAIALFLFVAGLEVDLSSVFRQGRAALAVAAVGMAVPFALGFGAAFGMPDALGARPDVAPVLFALFLATALAISALPVIAKVLLDLKLYRSDFGMLVIAAAILNDIVGWVVFSAILGMMGTEGGTGMQLGTTLGLTVGFAGLVLTLGRWLLDRALPWLQTHVSWPGGIIGVSLSVALACAAFTEMIGLHAIFGAFLVGVALGDSRHLRERTRATLDQFVSFFFAPIFFAGIGLKVDFAVHFDVGLVVFVILIATAGKVLGCSWAARMVGLPPNEAWAVGFGMNARGAMEIILGLLALRAGLIGERLFVALVVMALVTSIMAGTFIQRLLKRERPSRLVDFLSPSQVKRGLAATSRQEAIRELVELACHQSAMDPAEVLARVLEREEIGPTGLGNGLAAPHARLAGLRTPVVAAGLSPVGIDFDAPDGQPAIVIFLLLTPESNHTVQIELLGDLARTFRTPQAVDRASRVTSEQELLALLRIGAPTEDREFA